MTYGEAGRVFKRPLSELGPLTEQPALKRLTPTETNKVSGPHLECTGSQNAMIMWVPKGYSFIHS